MSAEYINTRVVSRQKLILKTTGILLGLLLYFFLHYYFAPEDVRTGLRSSKRWYSWNQFITFSSIAIVVIVPIMFWSRIVLRIFISVPDNKLSITLIDKFRWTSMTREVLLSQTQIQTEHVKETNHLLLRKTPEYFTLYLFNPAFGTLKVSGRDFDNINEIVQHFDQLKVNAAKKMRQRRLKRG